MASPASSHTARRPLLRPLWRSHRQTPAAATTSRIDDSSLDLAPLAGHDAAPAAAAAWTGWRLRLLIVAVLLGGLGLLLLTRAVMLAPHPDAHWRLDAQGRLELTGSADPALRPHIGRTLTAASGEGESVPLTDARALQRSPRWVIDDAQRARQLQLHDRLSAVLAHDTVTLSFADGTSAPARTHARAVTALPLQFWVLALFALALYLGASVVLLSQPSGSHLVYALMALFQCGNLLLIAVEGVLDVGLPTRLAHVELPLRAAFDLCTAAAMVHGACLNPRRLPGARWIAGAGWALALGLTGALAAEVLAGAWWWIQSTVAGLGLAAIGLLSWSYRIEPHPFAFMLRRFGIVTIATWVLLSAALAATDQLPGAPPNVADVGSLVWYLFLGSLLLLVPFLAKSQSFMREFSLLAAISTVATSLDLLFVSVFGLGQVASLTLSLFVSLAVYSGVRQWVLNQLLGSSMLTTERMFEQLYRIAREVEAQPERTPALLAQLLGDLFEPLEVGIVERRGDRSRIAVDGSGMLVPLPALAGAGSTPAALRIRFAQRGRRLFTTEDARLADRVVEQLRRAVQFDQAVEQGRSEERLRLAQDLHDDIGARLLTLMYKAQSPEMEEYLRHTLQDLKTLTRGLAASNHRLSHAAAEWKADLSHRLTAAHVELQWTFVFDDDIALTVVHWSALTRILRELVSNVIAHARAQRLDIDFRLEAHRLELTITDDGVGMNPRGWSHGLGLGGVRKRVKQLGGTVEWREIAPHGISCRVIVRDVSRWR